MFKKMSLKLYRKACRFENIYGSKMADKMIFGRMWYKAVSLPLIKLILKTHRNSGKKNILFDTSPDFNGNGKALFDYMKEQGIIGRYRVIWLVDNPREYKMYKTRYVKFVKRCSDYTGFHKVKCYRAILKSRYVFFSHKLSWIETKSKGQIYVGLGDGGSLLKKWQEDGRTNLDLLIVPGSLFEKSQQEFYSCSPKKILTIGNAACRLMFTRRPQAVNFFTHLIGENTGLKKIIWIPQYREPLLFMKYKTGAASMTGIPMIHFFTDMSLLNTLCVKNRIHLAIYCNPDSEVFCKEAGNFSHISYIWSQELKEAEVGIYELLPQFDAMLGDYSGITLDFLLLDKPLGYILQDYEEIQQAGGLIVKEAAEYMPGEKIYSMDDLAMFLRHISQGEDAYRQQRREVCGKIHPNVKDYCKCILEQCNIC